MAQPQLLQVKLSRFDAQPWGFRLQGGVDFAAPLLVQKVNGGSLAEQAGLLPGDAVLKINDVDVFNLRHKDAQDIVVRSGNNFVITVQRGGSTWRPQVIPTGHLPQPNQNSPYLHTVTKTSLAHKQQESQHIGCGYNNSARPFVNGGDGNVKSIVNKQYNTPVGIYSDASIAETLSAQAEVLAGGVLGVNFKKNEKEYNADKSEVLKFLREEETGHSTPVYNSQHYQDSQQQYHQQQQQQHHHQQQQQQHHHHQQQQQQSQQHYQQQHQQHQHHQQQQQHQQSATRHVIAPINSPKPPSTGGLPTGQNICNDCERLITGVFVRIKDKNLHVECFKCATCGTSLKNQGYYNFNNKLYCDIHAKLAALQHPPPGTEGYVPVPIKPQTKLSVNTITAALSAHGYNNGVANGSSTPTPAPVNQGYARPYGAAPPAAAPKSPVSYPPQQHWQQQQQQQQQPATNPYATLPRTNVGQQAPSAYSNTETPTCKLPSATTKQTPLTADAYQDPTIDLRNDEATKMLTESLGKIQMGDKTDNFMAEAGKIISNMLETRLANNNGQTVNNNNQPNSNKNQMLMRKRFELSDFKELDPTEPVSLRPIVAVNVEQNSNKFIEAQQQKAQLQMYNANNTLTATLPTNHAMSKVLDICDNKRPICGNESTKQATPMPPPAPAPALVPTPIAAPVATKINQINNRRNAGNSGGLVNALKQQIVAQTPAVPPPSAPPAPTAVVQPNLMPVKPMPIVNDKTKNTQPNNLTTATAEQELVVYRNNLRPSKNRQQRGGELSIHASDRRSYIEPVAQNDDNKDSAVFSVSVKALGGPIVDPNLPMSAENEQVVSQLLKDGKRPICCQCNNEIKKGPFITALGKIWCPDHFICVNGNCRRPLQDIGFVEEKGDLYCEYCFEKYLAPTCSKCAGKIKGDCLNAIGKHFHPECFTCGHCGKLFGNTPFFLEDGNAYCEADWNELFTTKCFACGFPVEAGDRWVEALNHNYHSQCFNCTYCKQNLEGQSFYNKGGRPFCKNHAR